MLSWFILTLHLQMLLYRGERLFYFNGGFNALIVQCVMSATSTYFYWWAKCYSILYILNYLQHSWTLIMWEHGYASFRLVNISILFSELYVYNVMVIYIYKEKYIQLIPPVANNNVNSVNLVLLSNNINCKCAINTSTL